MQQVEIRYLNFTTVQVTNIYLLERTHHWFNITTVHQVNCDDKLGAILNSSFTLSNGSTVQAFSSYGSNYVFMTSKSQFYSLNTSLGVTLIGNFKFIKGTQQLHHQ